MKVGSLVRHVPEERGFSRKSIPGLFLVTGFGSIGFVEVLSLEGKVGALHRGHLEVVR